MIESPFSPHFLVSFHVSLSNLAGVEGQIGGDTLRSAFWQGKERRTNGFFLGFILKPIAITCVTDLVGRFSNTADQIVCDMRLFVLLSSRSVSCLLSSIHGRFKGAALTRDRNYGKRSEPINSYNPS